MKYYLNKINFAQIWIFLVVLSIFFPIRHVFLTPSAYILGGYSDFTSFSIYLSDILIIIGFIIALFWYRADFKYSKIDNLIFILLGWLILATALHLKSNTPLNYYFLGRFIELLVLYETVKVFAKYLNISKVFYFFAILCLFETFLGIYQFSLQKSLGLHHVGESIIGPHVVNVAKILAEGLIFVRSYGTFPHANVFSAILVVGLMISLFNYYNLKTPLFKRSSILVMGIIFTGIILTFSRAGLLAGFSGVATFIILLFKKIPRVKYFATPLIVLTGVGLINMILLNHLLITRAQVFDTANHERKIYNDTGIEMVKKYPVFGVGVGTSLLHMQQFSPVHLEPFQVQPIHNYYLLLAVDIGVIGSLIIIIFFLKHLFALYKPLKLYYEDKNGYDGDIKNEKMFNMELLRITFLSIIVNFCVLMLFDHYFYTITQTQLLLWTTLGLASALEDDIKTHHVVS